MENFEELKLDNQLCFPLYACGKEITRLYKPYLDELGLTYTQYISMMVVWEEKLVTLKHLGARLFLDSGTLTPLLKKLEQKGYIVRKKDEKDDRNLLVEVTKQGLLLREKAKNIPAQIASCVNLSRDEVVSLYSTLHKILNNFNKE